MHATLVGGKAKSTEITPNSDFNKHNFIHT